MTTTYSPERGYPIPSIDSVPFIEALQDLILAIDRDIGNLVSVGSVAMPVWDNDTAYLIDARVLDPDTDRMFQCLVDHTSAAGGTFEADRTANPTYWERFGTSFNPTGAWQNSTDYFIMDHTYDTAEGISAVCVVSHTSNASGDIRDDAANWVYIVDLQQTISDETIHQIILQAQVFGG